MFVGRRTKYFYWQPGITINLSGFLKGYALETIRDILHSCSIENALINMGNSSVLALGNHPAGTGWKVNFGNQSETEKTGESQSILLYNECLTTSGNESEGRRHIISPQNGNFVEGLRQIAVVTRTGLSERYCLPLCLPPVRNSVKRCLPVSALYLSITS